MNDSFKLVFYESLQLPPFATKGLSPEGVVVLAEVVILLVLMMLLLLELVFLMIFVVFEVDSG